MALALELDRALSHETALPARRSASLDVLVRLLLASAGRTDEARRTHRPEPRGVSRAVEPVVLIPCCRGGLCA